jgi:hypothetical protein
MLAINWTHPKEDYMNINHFLRQFILDGLLGLGSLVLFVLLSNVVTLNSPASALDIFPHLLFIMTITSFLGTGFGTRLLANVSSRTSWLVSLFAVSSISWLVAMASIIDYIALFSEPRYRDYELYLLPTYAAASAFGAGIGFVIAGLIGLLFQPTHRYAKRFISGMITALIGYAFALFYVIIALIPT